MEIRSASTGDDGGGAERRGDPVWVEEHVETTKDIGHKVGDEELWNATDREAMNGGAEALLDGANGPFDFADVAVSGHDVHSDRENSRADTIEFHIGMDVTYVETAGTVEVDDGENLLQNGLGRTVRDERGRAETDTARDRV